MNITDDELASFAKIVTIHLPLIFLNVVGEGNFPASTLQSNPHQTNAGKKFSKSAVVLVAHTRCVILAFTPIIRNSDLLHELFQRYPVEDAGRLRPYGEKFQELDSPDATGASIADEIRVSLCPASFLPPAPATARWPRLTRRAKSKRLSVNFRRRNPQAGRRSPATTCRQTGGW